MKKVILFFAFLFMNLVFSQDSFQLNKNLKKSNNCFSLENGYDDFYFVDSIVDNTKKGNFFKKKSINDTLFVWSCGRDKVEVVIDTFSCSETTGKYKKDWETKNFIALIKPCGTNCWINIIVPLKKNTPIIYKSYSCIDIKNMNIVSIIDNSFLLENLIDNKSRYIQIENLEQINGLPIFNIYNIKLKNNLLIYNVIYSNGSVKKIKVKLH